MKQSPAVKVRVMRTQIYFSVGLTERNCFYINSYNKLFKKERGWTSNGKKILYYRLSMSELKTCYWN